MFNKDFFPTPQHVIEMMMNGEQIEGKIFLEPSAGKGDIVDYLQNLSAGDIIACEKNADLAAILKTKCKVISDDFLMVESHQVSHVDYIVMNPPFSADEKHILHAYHIAPPGCKIIALCNLKTVENPYTRSRDRLVTVIKECGSYEDLGDVFTSAERQTDVEIALVRMQKPGASAEDEFAGFFTEEDAPEAQANAIMGYNVVRDMVNRYVECMKLFDKQQEIGIRMHDMTGDFFHSEIAFSCTIKGKQQQRNEFKKDLQKSGWKYIFDKLDMDKYSTRGLKEDINKFVEKQTHIPFTMRNIYKMLEIVVGTTEQRMDKAIIEVFDKLTTHYDENRYNVEGWKTNSHYLMNEKFIIPGMCYQDQRWDKGKSNISTNYGESFELIEDMMKAICFITGDNYDNFCSLDHYVRYPYKFYSNGKFINSAYHYSDKERFEREYYEAGKPIEVKKIEPVYGEWFDWGFFECKAFKKGTMHFKFKNRELWARFNQRVARIKGYPLFEAKKAA